MNICCYFYFVQNTYILLLDSLHWRWHWGTAIFFFINTIFVEFDENSSTRLLALQ